MTGSDREVSNVSGQSRSRDRRRNTRHQMLSAGTEVDIHYTFMSVEGEASHPHTHAGTALNLSRTGMLLHGTIPDESWTTRLLNNEEILALRIPIPEGEPLQAVASVRWIRSSEPKDRFEIGLRFERLADGDLPRLERYLNRNKRRSDPSLDTLR